MAMETGETWVVRPPLNSLRVGGYRPVEVAKDFSFPCVPEKLRGIVRGCDVILDRLLPVSA